LLLTSFAPFNKGIFNTLNPKSASHAAVTGFSTRIPYQGGNWFVAGVNVPWWNWACDFGCGPSGGGVSGNASTFSAGFQQLKNAHVHMVRWWVFEGDPWLINMTYIMILFYLVIQLQCLIPGKQMQPSGKSWLML